MSLLKIIQCDYNIPEHCAAQINLLKIYMEDNMGNCKSFSDKENIRLIEGLKSHPTTLTLLAHYDTKFVGLTTSFINFATFSAQKFLNIHDVIVDPSYRSMGIGKKLMEENIRIAKEELNCSKITLEVREDNVIAKILYKNLGFNDCNPPMHFWVKYFI